jgi:hypothetical protein
MLAVPVVLLAEPARTSKEPKTILLIVMVQLIAAAAGVAMQQTVRAAINGIRGF